MKKSILTKHQVKTFSRYYQENGKDRLIIAKVRYDDECGNNHNSFSITGEIWKATKEGKKTGNDILTGGCIHEEIAKHFPELAQAIKFHLFNSTGPVHYIQNTVYLAGTKDCHGKEKWEPLSFEKAVSFGVFPIKYRANRDIDFLNHLEIILETNTNPDLAIQFVEHVNKPGDTYNFAPKYTFQGFPNEWYKCPFDTLEEAQEFAEALRTHGAVVIKTASSFSQGKERELDAARSSACWPDATDEDLTAPGLEQRLKDRLPALMEEFIKTVESFDFTF
jgi:hypothetical protein